ncbi:iron-containing alcohol dehydrogenase family protein [Enterococcus gallinarum]|uniref:iron-containing alcohol dehydrogenase family protein n=1 Tax=Enterococcus gallinarum TaxID=1353 RepID=UPI001F5AC230|nr:iron-containing alcohol dehydrogenase family protein [Enterococcus gallinarum]MCR1943817.1 iron-containing alcohol dehydrogenase family protein [Enterococcus gallinarum]
MLANEVRPGPNRYITGEGVLFDLPEYLNDFDQVAVITGDQSFDVFKTYYPHPFDYPVYRYDGSSSYENAQELADKIKHTDVLLAIGGGRVADTAKITAERMGAELIVIPTLVSNCAPFTPVIVAYYPDHTICKIDYAKKGAYMTIVDTRFLLATPVDYFIAGIADTLAKYYEMEAIVRTMAEEDKTALVRLGFQSAKLIKELLIADAIQAVTDLEAGRLTPAFARITDTIIALAGEVGGFAVEFGRTSGAHALHDGLSYLSETHSVLHGNKVAYCIWVQLAYTNDFAVIEELRPFYEALHLPMKLKDLHVTRVDRAYFAPVLTYAVKEEETFVLIDPMITPEKVFRAIEAVEAL